MPVTHPITRPSDDALPPMAVREYLHGQLVMGRYRPTGGDTLVTDRYATGYYRGKHLRVRLAHNERLMPWLDIACEPTFDRWANSTDFHVPFWPKNILRVLWEARRIIRDRGGPESFWSPDRAVDLSYVACPMPDDWWASELWAPPPPPWNAEYLALAQ